MVTIPHAVQIDQEMGVRWSSTNVGTRRPTATSINYQHSYIAKENIVYYYKIPVKRDMPALIRPSVASTNGRKKNR